VSRQCGQIVSRVVAEAKAKAEAEGRAKAEAERKVIAVSVRKERDEVEVRVEDSGPGVAASLAEHIFDPFFTTREPGEGMGMGLAISHRIITEHGGTIECAESELGGAAFTVRMPIG